MKFQNVFTSKIAKFFTVTALAGAFLIFSPTNANAEARRFYGREVIVRPAPIIVSPYFGVAPYYAPGPVFVGPRWGHEHRFYENRYRFSGRRF